MKILIYGAGIQGSYLAHALIKNENNDVVMLARGKRKETLTTQGLKLHHQLQRKTTTDTIETIDKLAPSDYYDLIFVTMKYNDFPAIVQPISENVSPVVIFVGNQMDTESLKQQILNKNPKKAVFFGFQNTGGTRTETAIKILRFNSGKMKINTTAKDLKTKQILDAAFKNTGYHWQGDPLLDSWLKSHAALILVLNSLDYLYDNNPQAIRKADQLLHTTAHAFGEAFAILEDNGYQILPTSQRKLFSNPRLAKMALKLIYSTSLMNTVQGNYAEIQAVADSFDQFKTRTNTNTPNLDILLGLASEKFKFSIE